MASRMAKLEDGKLVIGALYPNKLYSMEAAAMTDDGVALTYSVLLKTRKPSKFFSNCIHHIPLQACAEIFTAKLR